MKLSTPLKKIGLYKPAVLVEDLADKQPLKAKFCLYKSRLKRYRDKASKSFGPKVLVIINAGGISNASCSSSQNILARLRPDHLDICWRPV